MVASEQDQLIQTTATWMRRRICGIDEFQVLRMVPGGLFLESIRSSAAGACPSRVKSPVCQIRGIRRPVLVHPDAPWPEQPLCKWPSSLFERLDS